MATHQEALRFALTDEDTVDDPAGWADGETEHEGVEWGDDEAHDDEEWPADGDADEAALSWDSAPHSLDEQEDDDEPEDKSEGGFAAARASASPAGRRRLVGPAILSLGACLALVWAANHLPGPSSDARHGRDAMLFAEPLSSEPSQILRLARTPEAADADAQVQAWLAQPPPPVQKQPVEAREPDAVAKAGPVSARLESGVGQAKTAVDSAAVSASAKGALEGPPAPPDLAPAKPAAAVAAAPAKKKTPVQVAKAAAPAQRLSHSREPVYTVQLGAFKTRGNAEELAGKLRGKPTRILQEGGLYRVVSGSFASKRDAIVHEASLKRAGYSTYVRTAIF